MLQQPLKNGDCECCTRTDVKLTLQHGDKMCDECIAREAEVQRVTEVSNQVIASSRRQDDSIKLDKDIWNAATVSFAELGGAIQNNPSISDDEKHFALVQEAIARIQKFNQAIFTTKELLVNQENERNSWVKQTQDMVAKLRADQREKFKQYDLNYEPKSVKPSTTRAKSTTSSTGRGKTQSHPEVVAACAKYNADITIVKMMMLSRHGMTAEQAAQEYAAKHAD